MFDFQARDIDRVCRLGNVSCTKAIELLRRYGGKPERVMTEHFGRTRLYIEPIAVRDPAEERRDAVRRVWKRVSARRLTLSSRGGRVVFSAPLWLAVAAAAATAPFSAAAALGAMAAGYRFSTRPAGEDAGGCPDMA